MSSFEVDTPILCSPFDEPGEHWWIEEGKMPDRRAGRRPAGYWYRDPKPPSPRPASRAASGRRSSVVNLTRERIAAWREQDYPGVTRTTLELLEWWRREGRRQPLFFAQLEAAET